MRTPPILLASAALLALAGCGAQVSAPTLAPRAVEKQPIEMPVTTATEAESPVDAALVAKIAALVASAEAGDKTFSELRLRTADVVSRASGTAQGGEAWVAAQEAVTALESARGPVHDAAGAVDALRVDPANAAAGNRNAIDAAAARIEAIERAEAAAIAELNAKLG